MQQLIKKVHNTAKRICKPNPKLYPEPSVHQFIWNRSVTSLYVFMLFLVFVIPFVLQGKFCFIMNLIVVFVNSFQFLCFILLCRSYLRLFNILCIPISMFYTFTTLEMIPEAVYLYVGYMFLMVTCMIVLSGDVKVTLFAGAMHVVVCLTKFREKLAILIQNEEPEVFAGNFVRNLAFVFVITLLAVITLAKTLEKRSFELLKAKSALESALEQQKTFIFSFSHELRNPINSLLGNLQLVLQQQGGGSLSANVREMLSIAKVCGEILLHNINNVLDTGKYEIGRLEINPVATPLCEFFQRTWSIYSELLKQKKLKGQLKIDKEIPAVVKIDSHKLSQILLNLIGNSIKFTEKGSVVVTAKWLECSEVNEKCFEPIPYDEIDEGLFEKEENLSTTNTSRISESRSAPLENEARRRFSDQQESKGVLKIIVKDTGSGMKKEAVDKLFQKFSQVSDDASQRQIGTGLGLFITKEICLAMGGEIRAYSKFRVGTTFIACIPTKSMPSNDVQRANSESVLRQLTQRNIKALVADDSPFNVNLIGNYFSQFGASVVAVAYNGYDAYMKYKECIRVNGHIDVITLDIDMPLMDGKSVCDRIRKCEKENRLKPAVIILISGNYDKEQVNDFVNPENGLHRADYFLRKPVSYSEFNRAIYNLLFPERNQSEV